MTIDLNYNLSGSGELIVILHGLFGSSRNWQTLARQLSNDYQVMTVDLRNHGSSGHASTMTYPEMADDVHHLIEKYTADPVILIGHSMGGKVAMMQSLQNPDTINKLMVLDIAPVSYAHRYGKIFHAMNNLPLNNIKNRNEAEIIFSEWITDSLLRSFLLQNLVRNESGFTWRINLPVIQNSIEQISSFPEMANDRVFKRPVLFLGGEKSDFILPNHHEKVYSLFPDASIEQVKNAGHMLHVEETAVVLQKTRDFLES